MHPRSAETPAPKIAAVAQPDDGLPPGAIRAPAPDTERSIPRETIDKLGLEKGASRGPANAPVVITVFTDMRCKYCAAALSSLDQLFDEYPNKLRIVVKQLPVHDSAKLAAEASFAADAQGKFWQLHDLMLANQDDLSRDGLLALAPQAGLDVDKFRVALDQHSYKDDVATDMKAAQEIDINATPAFVINGRKIVGNVPVTFFRDAIESALHE
jgi:protein-disulfide isomerase